MTRVVCPSCKTGFEARISRADYAVNCIACHTAFNAAHYLAPEEYKAIMERRVRPASPPEKPQARTAVAEKPTDQLPFMSEPAPKRPESKSVPVAPAVTPPASKPSSPGSSRTPQSPASNVPAPHRTAKAEPPRTGKTTARRPLLEGAFGPYEIESEIARGGVGAVFRAHERAGGRRVALKILLETAEADETERERFRRECETSKALNLPGMVQVYDVGEVEGKPYMAMELIEGRSLDRVIPERALSVNDALVLMQSVADTAGALHESGYVHRDLKPANILLDQYNTPKVADFGLVKSLDEVTRLTASGLVCGTPAYMAPEQARGEGQAINPRSDVWALGAVLYELLTSKPPFQAENALRLMLKITKESPQPPQELNPRIPREVSLIVLKCLEKNPDRRYPNGRALAADLQRFLSGQPVQARSTSVTRMLRGASAYRKPAALVAAGLLVAALAVMLARWFFVAPDPQALAESGWQSWNAQKTAEAETRFQQALKLDPLNGRAGIGLGLIRATACLDLQTGRVINPQGFREAIELMQKAGEDDPRVADLAAHWCAKLHHKAGNLVEEVRMRERAVRFCPDNPDYRQCLGLAYWNFAASLILRDQPAKRKECLERAVTEFNAVLKINPNYPQTRGYIAKIQEQWLSRNASAVSSAAPRRPL